MAKSNDILICYSNLDNETDWVSNFKKFIELMLTQVLGEKPEILMKSDLEPIDDNQLKSTHICIPVFSTAFMESGECLDTLEAFAKSTTSKNMDLSHHIFKVMKYPVPVDSHPSKVKELLGYDFYQVNYESGEIEDFSDFFSSEAEKNYWMRLVDLVYDIDDTLIRLKGESNITELKPDINRKSIYLAETGHDLVVQKNIIRRELLRHGYNVLPTHTLPTKLEDLENNVRKEVEECSLSIHLIGNSYGEIPDDSERSVVDIQNKIAAERSTSMAEKSSRRDFSRLIWISPSLTQISERQKAFIENIKRDTAALEGAEILQTPLEDFKNIIREELVEKGLGDELDNEDAANSTPQVYLMHDKMDEDEVVKIKKKVEKNGFKVLVPAFEGELLSLRQQHIDNLRRFDIALIYKGKVNDQWVRMKVLDILKAPGFGRSKPILGKAIVGAPGDQIDKDSFKANEVEIISGESKKIEESLQYFLDSTK